MVISTSEYLRIVPDRLDFNDFIDGTVVSKMITVLNVSSKRINLLMEAPKTTHFAVKNFEQLCGVALAPGLSCVIEIEFRFSVVGSCEPGKIATFATPGASTKALAEMGPVHDCVVFSVDGYMPFRYQLAANPAKPKLIVDSVIDFGAILLPSFAASDCQSKKVSDKTFIKYIKVANEGPVAAQINVKFDPNLPIRISPAAFSLRGCGSDDYGSDIPTETLKIEFQPSTAGLFVGTIHLRSSLKKVEENRGNIDNKSSGTQKNIKRKEDPAEALTNSNESMPPLASIGIKAQVLDRQIYLFQQDGSSEINDCDIDFGALYQGEASIYVAKVVNNGPAAVRWKFFDHESNDLAALPHNPDDQSKTFAIVPASGILSPYANTVVQFHMKTKKFVRTLGFRNEKINGKAVDQRARISLQMVEPLSLLAAKDAPIKFTISGSICPVEASLDSYEIDFGSVLVGDCRQHTVRLSNPSTKLPIMFSCDKIAHFKVTPPMGIISPGQTMEIEVAFNPSQIGVFRKTIIFKLFCPRFSYLKNGKDEPIEELQLELSGTTEPKNSRIVPTNAKRPQITAEEMIKRERVNLENHRKKYDELIADHRLKRYGKEKDRRLGIFFDDDINEIVDLKIGTRQLFERWNQMDPNTGLTAPHPDIRRIQSDIEVLERHSLVRNVSVQKIDSASKIGSTPIRQKPGDETILQTLFDALLSADTIELHGSNSFTIGSTGMLQKVKRPHSSQKSSGISTLSPVDLANIFTPTQKLDFGELYNHCEKSIRFSFLNSTPSKTPIFVSMEMQAEASFDIKDDIKISPQSMVLAPMSIGIFTVTLRTHRKPCTFIQGKARDFDGTVVYRINGQYEYRIPAIGSIKPVGVFVKGDHETSGCLKLKAVMPKDNEPTDLPKGQKTVEIVNNGGYPVWVECFSNRNIESLDGYFQISPRKLRIPAHGSTQLSLSFIAGLLPSCPDTLSVVAYDAFYRAVDGNGHLVSNDDGVGESLAQTQQISLLGEIGETKHAFYGFQVNSKRVPVIDFGCIPRAGPYFSNISRTAPPKRHKDYIAKSFKIRNVGRNPAYFTIQSCGKGEINFGPQSGILEADGGILDLNVWVVPMNATQRLIREDLRINFFGSGKSLIIPVTYHCKVAKFTIIRNNCEWNSEVVVGSTEKGEITIRNESDISGKLCIDLRDYDDFDLVSEKTKIYDSGEPDETLSNSRVMKELPAITIRNPLQQEEDDWLNQGNIGKSSDRLFVIEILPGHYATLGLYFKPKYQCRYSFNLPLLTENVKLSPSSIPVKAAAVYSPLKITRTNIIFKNKLIYPKQVGIMRPNVILRETVEIENVSSNPISWYTTFGSIEKPNEHDESAVRPMLSIRRKTSPSLNPNSDVFKFDCREGLLQPGESRKITITFNPLQVGSFNATAPIFVDSFVSDKPPVILELLGLGLEPSLAIQPPELFIPAIPLGEEITVPISIINHGYEKTELSYSISDDVAILLSSTSQTKKNSGLASPKRRELMAVQEKKVSKNSKGALEITFPEGNILKNEGEALALSVKFRAPASDHVAFSTHIQFHIDVIKSSVSGDVKMRKTYFLPVHGTADNSVMTIWPYVVMADFNTRHSRGDEEDLTLRVSSPPIFDGNHPTTMEMMLKVAGPEETPRRRKVVLEKFIFRSPGGIPLESNAKDFVYSRMIEILQKWIIKPFGLSIASEEFPVEFVQLHGRPLLDIIYSLTEKKGVVPNPPQNFGEARDVDGHLESLLHYYGDLLNSLKILGASLSFVKPEFLLSVDEFRYWWKLKLKKSQVEGNLTAANLQREEYYAKLESKFKFISQEAWIHLLMQVGKLFAVDKITIKNLKNMPGFVFRDDDQDSLAPLGILSNSERVLLKWVSCSYFKSTGCWKKLLNFEKDFKDGTVIGQVLLCYLNELQVPACMKNINWVCVNDEDQIQNQRVLMQALHELFLSKNTETKGIVSGSDKIGQIEFGDIKLGDQFDMLFLMCFLYQTLPQFIPKSKIEFSGNLHDKCCRSIEISNMSYKPIAYVLSMSASRDFAMKTKINDESRDSGNSNTGKTVILAPKSNASLTVEFVARFIKAEKGLLMLKSKAMALNNSSILSYQLVPLIESVEPTKIFKLELPLYQTNPEFVFMVEIENPFQSDGKFSVTLKESKVNKSNLRTIGSKNLSGRALTGSKKLSSKAGLNENGTLTKRSVLKGSNQSLSGDKNFWNNNVPNDANPPSFYMKDNKKLFIPAKSSIRIAIGIIPFEIGEMDCVVHLSDPEVGEFLYRIDLNTTLPAQTETLTFRTQPGIPAHRTINLDSGSRIREKAVVSALENMARAAKSIPADRPVSIEESELKKYRPPSNEELKYKVIYDSPHWSGPSEIKIQPLSAQSKRWQPAGYSAMETSRMDVVVAFKAKDKGVYRGKMILTCIDFPDTRVIELAGHVQEKTVPTVDLHIECFAGRELIQELPVANRSAQDWAVKATLEPSNGNAVVSGPVIFPVRAGHVGMYPISFKPRIEDVGRSFIVTLMLESLGFYQQRFVLHVKPLEDVDALLK